MVVQNELGRLKKVFREGNLKGVCALSPRPSLGRAPRHTHPNGLLRDARLRGPLRIPEGHRGTPSSAAPSLALLRPQHHQQEGRYGSSPPPHP